MDPELLAKVKAIQDSAPAEIVAAVEELDEPSQDYLRSLCAFATLFGVDLDDLTPARRALILDLIIGERQRGAIAQIENFIEGLQEGLPPLTLRTFLALRAHTSRLHRKHMEPVINDLALSLVAEHGVQESPRESQT